MRVETASSSATWKWKYCNFKSHPSHSFFSLPIVLVAGCVSSLSLISQQQVIFVLISLNSNIRNPNEIHNIHTIFIQVSQQFTVARTAFENSSTWQFIRNIQLIIIFPSLSTAQCAHFIQECPFFCHAAAEQQQPKKIYPISNSGNRRTKYRTKRRQRHRRRCEKKARKKHRMIHTHLISKSLNIHLFHFAQINDIREGRWKKKSVASRVHHSVVVKNNLNKTVEFLINFFKSHSSSPFFRCTSLLRHGRALDRVRELKEVETEMEKTNSSRGWNDSKSNLKSELHLR